MSQTTQHTTMPSPPTLLVLALLVLLGGGVPGSNAQEQEISEGTLQLSPAQSVFRPIIVDNKYQYVAPAPPHHPLRKVVYCQPWLTMIPSSTNMAHCCAHTGKHKMC